MKYQQNDDPEMAPSSVRLAAALLSAPVMTTSVTRPPIR
jgi:hypothetical protein